MARTTLPSGENVNVTPEEILRYLNPDGLRQLMRQERLRWNLKTNKDIDYYANNPPYKYTGEVHNEGLYQRIEIRTFPDNGAYNGYAGINNDSGLFGIPHNIDKWDEAWSEASKDAIVNRTLIGAMATIPGLTGYGLTNSNTISTKTNNRMAMILFDPYDGRIYSYTNDDPNYVNNETRSIDDKLPARTVARIGDIPTRVAQLINDTNSISDPDYRHTDNNFTNSNRYILDNLDDRTFVYPEISKDVNGDYVSNIRIGLDGNPGYDESDNGNANNTHDDPNNDRGGAAINSYNKNQNYSGVSTASGFLPGVFRSLEELEKVDLVNQKQLPLSNEFSMGAKRHQNYYSMDGIWSSKWYDTQTQQDSYLKNSLIPNNMEIENINREPKPYKSLHQDTDYSRAKLYQWRYNRIDVKYLSENITIEIVNPGESYDIGDILIWTFGDDYFKYQVTQVGSNGEIQDGIYLESNENEYDIDPSTHGVGIEFINTTGVGHGAKLSINTIASVITHASQIKNNLYAYVDITPTVRSNNESVWSDIHNPDGQNGMIEIRSTAAGPAYSGINSGRGGPSSEENSPSILHEHGGNPTAGVHVHLFRYVIDTENPRYVTIDGEQVFLGKWVDQGPMGVERPCDIKALLFSNPDTNNFNNYYKFSNDLFMDTINRNPDSVMTNDNNAVSIAYIHIDQVDPTEDRRFTEKRINPNTNRVEDIDITQRVLYINAATGIIFHYNMAAKKDNTYGYGYRSEGWQPIAGAISK